MLFVSPFPESYLAALPEVAITAGVTFESIKREINDAKEVAKAELVRWSASNGMSSDPGERLDTRFAVWTEQSGDLESLVALTGRVHDLIIIDKPKVDDLFSQRVFEASVFSAGRPVLVVPAIATGDPLRHVVIAWNGSLEAAHVVGQSIALLHEADRVSVIQVAEHKSGDVALADLPAYLRWHGIVASSRSPDRTADQSTGAAILDEVERLDGSMLVMGAYTHSRLRQIFLGGVTRDVIARSKVPILMTH
jgi:nucleotide-binding universal stress UspA family protein